MCQDQPFQAHSRSRRAAHREDGVHVDTDVAAAVLRVGAQDASDMGSHGGLVGGGEAQEQIAAADVGDDQRPLRCEVGEPPQRCVQVRCRHIHLHAITQLMKEPS